MTRLPPAPALAAALLIALATPGVASALEREQFVRLGTSVLRVEVQRSDGGTGFGSGVTVGREAVVTNCHVTRGAREILVARGGVRRAVAAQAADAAHDLCLLQVPGLQADPVPLGRTASLAVGQPLTALGYTGGTALRASGGEIVQLHRHDGARVIQASNWFNSGASGGALFDDRGALVGILTFRLRGTHAHYYAAPIEWVRQLLDAAERGGFREVKPSPRDAVAFWEEGQAARPRFLQAAMLVNDVRWSELHQHARAWLRSDPEDAEPWTLLGIALIRLGQPSDARFALQCALRLERDNRLARAWLARTLPASTSWLEAPPPCEAS